MTDPPKKKIEFQAPKVEKLLDPEFLKEFKKEVEEYKARNKIKRLM